MIKSFRHKGLKRLYEEDDRRGFPADQINKLRIILARLDASLTIHDMDLSGLALHALKGMRKNQWAVTVKANWRVVCEFSNGDAFNVDYLDYH